MTREHAQDTILKDATFITMDDARSTAPGMWTRGDRIVALGDPDDLRGAAGRDAEVVSLEGATVVPGFSDVHCHISSFAITLAQADVGQPQVPDIAALKRVMREQAAKTPAGVWVVGNGYVEYKLRDQRHPNRHDLDEAIPDRPCVIYHTSGHACAVNTIGLHEMGLGEESADPPGGFLERDEHGKATGVIFEQPMFELADRLFYSDTMAMSPAERAALMAKASAHYASMGLTSCSDAGANANGAAFRMFRDAEAAGTLAVRIACMFNYGVGDWLIDAGMTTGFGSDWLQVGAIKIFADGGMSSRSAAVEEPYPVPPFGTGVLFLEQDEMTATIRKYHDAGFQVGIHAQGDRGIRTALQGFEDVIGTGSGNVRRHRLEHGGALYAHLIAKSAAIGIHVASQPAFLSTLGDGFLDAFGDDHGQLLYPFASIQKAGLVVGGSSDNPVITEDVLLAIRDAVTRKTEAGRSIGASERLSAVDALALYTRNAAWLSHHEAVKGSLEPGKLADYVVLSENPLAAEPDAIAGITIRRTVAGGNATYEA